MKKTFNHVYKTNAFAITASWLIFLYLKIVYSTSKKIFHNSNAVNQIWDSDNGIIVCFWHNRLLLAPFAKPKNDTRNSFVISTHHRDGRYTNAIAKTLNAQPIFGSTSKDASKILKQCCKILKQKSTIAITPDGPRGPSQIAAKGPAYMSKLANAWILPVTYAAKNKKIAKSWDKLIIPTPFNTLNFYFGNPFKCSDFNNDIEKCRLHLQNELNKISEYVDSL